MCNWCPGRIREKDGQKKYLKKNIEVVIERLKNSNLSGIFPINEASGPDGFTGKFYRERKNTDLTQTLRGNKESS